MLFPSRCGSGNDVEVAADFEINSAFFNMNIFFEGNFESIISKSQTTVIFSSSSHRDYNEIFFSLSSHINAASRACYGNL